MIVKNIIVKHFRSDIRIASSVVGKNGVPRELYFDISGIDSKFITSDASCFIPALLPLAMSRGENLEIEGSVSPKILIGQQKFQNQIAQWEKSLQKVAVKADSSDWTMKKGKKIGLFFSGGVDSFYTFLKNRRYKKDTITDFILIWGFDIPLKDTKFFSLVKKRIINVSRLAGVNLIIVETNLKELASNQVEWQWQVGGSLAAIALILQNYFRVVYIASATSKEDTAPFGSHPLLDPLWSTQHLKIVHEADGCSRLERVGSYIAKSPLALRNLRVCWKQVKGKYNCGRCEKCLRTMMELELAGALSQAKTFKQPLDLHRVSKTVLPSSGLAFSEEVLQKLRQRNEHIEMQYALDRQLEISKHLPIGYQMKKFVHTIDHKFNNDKIFWYLSARGLI